MVALFIIPRGGKNSHSNIVTACVRSVASLGQEGLVSMLLLKFLS